jgi:hypothetical protein
MFNSSKSASLIYSTYFGILYNSRKTRLMLIVKFSRDQQKALIKKLKKIESASPSQHFIHTPFQVVFLSSS